MKMKQQSKKPTKKVIAASAASFVAAALVAFLSSKGVDVSAADAASIEQLTESLAMGLIGLALTLAAGWFRRPGTDDGVTTDG